MSAFDPKRTPPNAPNQARRAPRDLEIWPSATALAIAWMPKLGATLSMAITSP